MADVFLSVRPPVNSCTDAAETSVTLSSLPAAIKKGVNENKEGRRQIHQPKRNRTEADDTKRCETKQNNETPTTSEPSSVRREGQTTAAKETTGVDRSSNQSTNRPTNRTNDLTNKANQSLFLHSHEERCQCHHSCCCCVRRGLVGCVVGDVQCVCSSASHPSFHSHVHPFQQTRNDDDDGRTNCKDASTASFPLIGTTNGQQ